MKRWWVWLGVVGLLSGQAMAGEAEADTKALRSALAHLMPGVEPDSLVASKFPGMYEAIYGTEVVYVSKDGRYLFQGDIVDVKKQRNLTENTRTGLRKKLLDSLNESEMIVFSPKKTKYTITVFTDVDCGYCRKLHSEIDQYLDRGIRVRYMSFPRSGENTESYYKAVAVWCSDDRQKALTQSKNGEKLPNKTCDNPVRKQMHLAESFGVNGTPTIIMETGDVIPGYVPAARLEQALAQATAAQAKN